MKHVDLWTATKEEVLAFFREDLKPEDSSISCPTWGGLALVPDRLSPIERWRKIEEVKTLRSEIEAGDGLALFQAIRILTIYSLPSPGWLSEIFSKKMEKFSKCEIMSFDDPEMFGKPFPPNFKKEAFLKRRKLFGEVICGVSYLIGRRIHEDNPDMDNVMDRFTRTTAIEEFAKGKKLGRDVVRELFAEGERLKKYQLKFLLEWGT